MTFGERLKKLRNSNGWTQEQIADKLEVDRVTVTHYESEYRQPDFEKLIKLSSIFNVSVDYLLKGDGTEEKKPEISKYAKMLYKAMDKSDLTMEEVARRITHSGHKIHASYLGKLISGKREPASDDTNKALAEFFNLDQLELRTLAWIEKIPFDILERIKENKPNE